MTKETTLMREAIDVLAAIAALAFFVAAFFHYHTGDTLNAICLMLGAIFCGQGK